MKFTKKGSVTVFLAWGMFAILSFGLVLVEGVRVYYIRTKTMQAVELAEFSVLSEYQQELLEHYGVFFLDLDYETGEEQPGILRQRAQKYLDKNSEEVQTLNLEISNFERATDSVGSAFFMQAVESVKVQSGYGILETFLEEVGNVTFDAVNLQEILHHSESEASGLLSRFLSLVENRFLEIALPEINFPSIEVLSESIFGSMEDLSQKSIEISDRLDQRMLVQGVGETVSPNFMDIQLFHWYLFQNFAHYGEENIQIPKEQLAYQLEYIISGKESDGKNLENIMWRIFLLRAGGDYLFYHQDVTQLELAEMKAIALVGITGDLVLIKLVRELFLIAQAIENGIQETKTIFAGGKVPLYENGVFAEKTIGYQEYLYLFLNTTGLEQKIYRSMDLIELEIRKSSGYESFRFDHCVESFDLEWNYQFDSLFRLRNYQNTIKCKVNYEM